MNPDLEKRVPREILAELIEEGTEAFRGILEKLFNVAMQLERSEFLGAEGPCCMDHPEGCLIIVFFNTGDNLDAT